MTWEELKERELELRNKYAEKKPTSSVNEVSKQKINILQRKDNTK